MIRALMVAVGGVLLFGDLTPGAYRSTPVDFAVAYSIRIP